MSLPIYQRVAVTDAGDVIPGAEYTVINENTGVAQPIYSDRTGLTLLTPPYFADSVGTIQFFIAQGTTFRVAASGGVGTYTDRYVYGVAEAVLVQADGNVGIGTSSTNGLKAVILGATGYPENTGTTQTGVLRLSGGTGLYNVLDMGVNESTNTAWMQSTRANSLGIYDDFALQPNGGDVGIGTTNPNSLGSNITTLHIKGGVNDRTGGLRLTSLDNSVDGYMYGAASLMTFGTQTATPVRFLTSAAERMRIDSAGRLLVGTTTATGGGAKFQVSGGTTNEFISHFTGVNYGKATRLTTNGYADFFYTPTGFAGYIGISTDNNTTSYTTASDYRLKTDIVPMVGATDKVKLLKPCNFEWINSGQRVDGFLAHELKEVIPAAAFGDKDEMMDESYEVTPAVLDNDGAEIEAAIIGTRSVPKWQTIDQAKIVPLLTATIQELIARIEALEAGA